MNKQYIFRSKLRKRTTSRAVMLGLIVSIVLAPTAFAENDSLVRGNSILSGKTAMLSAW